MDKAEVLRDSSYHSCCLLRKVAATEPQRPALDAPLVMTKSLRHEHRFIYEHYFLVVESRAHDLLRQFLELLLLHIEGSNLLTDLCLNLEPLDTRALVYLPDVVLCDLSPEEFLGLVSSCLN